MIYPAWQEEPGSGAGPRLISFLSEAILCLNRHPCCTWWHSVDRRKRLTDQLIGSEYVGGGGCGRQPSNPDGSDFRTAICSITYVNHARACTRAPPRLLLLEVRSSTKIVWPNPDPSWCRHITIKCARQLSDGKMAEWSKALASGADLKIRAKRLLVQRWARVRTSLFSDLLRPPRARSFLVIRLGERT